MAKIYRHGDLLIKQIQQMPQGLKKSKDNILALGEATGHHHKLLSNQICVFLDERGNKYIDLNQETILTHEEHKPITIDLGLYQVITEREYDVFTEAIQIARD